MTEDKYKQDGVDIVEGDKFSDYAAKLCRSTYGNSPYVEVKDFSRGHFRGPRGFRLKGLPRSCWLEMAPDGKGTKSILVDAAGNYDHAANGLAAMVCGDITRWGGLPLVLVNNLDTGGIGEEGDEVNQAFRRMLASLKGVADDQGFIMYKGETAELGACVHFENKNALTKFLWSAVAFGVYNPKTIITGDYIRPGMPIMALQEDGPRNNGISLIRKAMAIHYGGDFYSMPEAQEDIKRAATPAVLYDKFLATANGWFNDGLRPLIDMRLIIHVTGGAMESKFAWDILFPRGLSAKLDNLWDPPQILRDCAKWRGLSDRECYKFLGCGQGVLVVLGCEDLTVPFMELALQFGLSSCRAGEISKESSPEVTIVSKFNGDIVKYTPVDKD